MEDNAGKVQQQAQNSSPESSLGESMMGKSGFDATGGLSMPPPPGSLSASAGLMPGVEVGESNQVVGGVRTAGEKAGDALRPAGTAVGNATAAVTGAVSGITISSTTNSAATWNPNGHFDWRVGFGTSGTNGWIVQEVLNTYRAENAAGASVVPAYTPHYWEAWEVDAASKVTPARGANNDYWVRPGLGASRGHWSMKGKCFFTTTDPATQGFAAGNVPDAGILLSSVAQPAGLGSTKLHRYAQGHWDSTVAAPYHKGSAGP